MSTLLPLFWKQSLGFSSQSIGYLSAAGLCVSLFAPMVFGRLGSKYPPERIILFSYLVYAAIALSFLSSELFTLQLLCFALLSFSQNGFFTLVPVAILHTLKDTPGREYGGYRRIGSFGFLLGIIGIGYLTDIFGTHILPLGMALFVLIAAYPFTRYIEIPCFKKSEDVSYRSLLQKPHFLLFLLGTALIWTSTSLISVFLPLRLDELGAANSTIAWIMSLNGVIAVLFLKLVGQFTDGRNTLKLLLFVPVFYALRIYSMGLPEESIAWFFLIQLFHIPTWVLYDVLAIKYVKEHTEDYEFTRAQALVQIANYAGMALGSAVASSAIAYFGLKGCFVACAPLPLIGFVLYVLVYKRSTRIPKCHADGC